MYNAYMHMQKILLVEDDQFMKSIYLKMLSSIYELDSADDGETAYISSLICDCQ